MRDRHWRQLAGVALLSLLVSCSKGSSAPAPTAPVPTPRAAVSASVLNLEGGRSATGWTYVFTVRLQETAGVSATVSSVQLRFLSNGTLVATLTPQTPFSGSLSGGGSLTSRTFNVSDDNVGNPYASHVEAVVGWTDANGNVGTATASGAVPALPPPPAPPVVNTFTVDRTSIEIGDSVVLTWSVTGATTITINNGVGTVAASGTRTVVPRGPDDYVLTASNAGSAVTSRLSLNVSIPSGICAASTVPTSTTAVCNNGQFSQSQNRSGTCSQNGGVRCWVCPGALCRG